MTPATVTRTRFRASGQTTSSFSRAAGPGSAFLATVEGRRLTFELEDGAVIDRETRSVWDGAARVAGPLEGARLEPLPTRPGFWFSIAGAYPGLELYAP